MADGIHSRGLSCVESGSGFLSQLCLYCNATRDTFLLCFLAGLVRKGLLPLGLTFKNILALETTFMREAYSLSQQSPCPGQGPSIPEEPSYPGTR